MSAIEFFYIVYSKDKVLGPVCVTHTGSRVKYSEIYEKNINRNTLP